MLVKMIWQTVMLEQATVFSLLGFAIWNFCHQLARVTCSNYCFDSFICKKRRVLIWILLYTCFYVLVCLCVCVCVWCYLFLVELRNYFMGAPRRVVKEMCDNVCFFFGTFRNNVVTLNEEVQLDCPKDNKSWSGVNQWPTIKNHLNRAETADCIRFFTSLYWRSPVITITAPTLVLLSCATWTWLFFTPPRKWQWCSLGITWDWLCTLPWSNVFHHIVIPRKAEIWSLCLKNIYTDLCKLVAP